uniref:Flavin-containing monooxygenase n=2 Tax=Cicer arietinum TaxID=3827 RepID=A0A1S2YD20_CICAR|nr:probable indole-3-pyruvate monooxygenase YUCCA10 [Cicer arietinum]
MEVPVVIVGAGPAGLATSACLNKHSIPNIVLEKDDCHAPLWRKKTYDRLKLHLSKEFCNLPHMSFSSDLPTFVPRVGFLRYLDDYVTHMKIDIRCNRYVDDASYDVNGGKWRVSVKGTTSFVDDEIYVADYLVVATGENCEAYIPKINGLESFEGEYIHCSNYLNGRPWYNKNVLVVGSGNSGMEISYDLSTWGANTSIVIRSPVHYFSKEMVYMGMCMLKYLNVETVDKLMVGMSKMKYGDMSKYGLIRPKEGPFAMKNSGKRTPTIDVGCVKKIKKGIVKVYPAISTIKNDKIVEFADGKSGKFDVIIFATGYRTNVHKWLKDYKEMFNENGIPKRCYPNHWKGEKGIYCAGFTKRALQGIAYDAKQIANDIKRDINARNQSATA